MHQRFPLYARPIPFLIGAAMFLGGLQMAFNWAWEWSLQTGNLFLQISIPTRLIVFEGPKLFFWILSALGLLVFAVFGTVGRRTARLAHEEGGNPFWVPRFRFHLVTFLLGLFLLYFGIVFLFHASMSGDDTPSGFVAFVYLNYDGIVRRSIISIFSLLLIIAGLSCSLYLAIKPGLGFETRRTETPTPAPVAERPEPTPTPAPAPRPAPPLASVPKKPAAARPRPVATASVRAKPAAAKPATSAAARRPRAPSASRSS